MTDRKQISIRLPAEVVDQIDARRAPQGISRDEWALRAFRYCLGLPTPDVKP